MIIEIYFFLITNNILILSFSISIYSTFLLAGAIKVNKLEGFVIIRACQH